MPVRRCMPNFIQLGLLVWSGGCTKVLQGVEGEEEGEGEGGEEEEEEGEGEEGGEGEGGEEEE